MKNVPTNKSFRKKQNLKLKFLLIPLTLFLTISVIFISTFQSKMYNSNLRKKIYNSMTKSKNRITAYNKAVNLNNGASANTCVYFLSEVLRMNGEKINNSVCNTNQLLDIMKEEGWKKEKNYKKLRPGDICFTTDSKLNKYGTPSHTYIFMKWKEKGKYDYAYVCDNQAKDYDWKIYHIRNIAKVDYSNGHSKDPFSFFMYKRD
ncbi:hypothetical protein ACFIJ5_09035 [Haloimpatiens sp. FM7330]|uniref:hypothetical protein n=1 Tax=Haloimpatiens sp. FM7330 TaxID=3298610 RepID=UPI0036415BD8